MQVRSYMAKKETEELEEPTLEDLEEEDIEEIFINEDSLFNIS